MTLELQCPACGATFKADAAFCAACGRKRALELVGIGFAVKLYLALLAVQIPLVALIHWAHVDVFLAIAFGTAAMALITFATAAVHRRLVIPLYARGGFSPLGYALIVLAAPAVVLVVGGYVHGLAHVFGIPAPRELDGFEGHGLAAAIGLIAIAPPVFEELAFRGLIYGALAQSLRRSEAYLISSFAFAILHLSIPSLLTHLPLGLYFCWLRERSGSIYPAMFAHFCHNLAVVIAELNGWW